MLAMHTDLHLTAAERRSFLLLMTRKKISPSAAFSAPSLGVGDSSHGSKKIIQLNCEMTTVQGLQPVYT